MKVITKTIENDAGVNVSCWIAESGRYELAANKGTVTLVGYKDVAAYQAGKSAVDCKEVRFALTDISSFETIWSEIATKLVTTGELAGGSIVDA